MRGSHNPHSNTNTNLNQNESRNSGPVRSKEMEDARMIRNSANGTPSNKSGLQAGAPSYQQHSDDTSKTQTTSGLSALVTQVKLGGPSVVSPTSFSAVPSSGIGATNSKLVKKTTSPNSSSFNQNQNQTSSSSSSSSTTHMQQSPSVANNTNATVLKESGRKSSKPLIEEKSVTQQINLNRGPKTTTNSSNNG